MFVNALCKAISTFSISLKRNNRNFLSKRYGVIANVSDIMLRPLGVPNVPTSVFQQGGNFNGVCIDLVRLNAHRVIKIKRPPRFEHH